MTGTRCRAAVIGSPTTRFFDCFLGLVVVLSSGTSSSPCTANGSKSNSFQRLLRDAPRFEVALDLLHRAVSNFLGGLERARDADWLGLAQQRHERRGLRPRCPPQIADEARPC